MKKLALAILLFTLASPAWATSYFLATAAGGGSDSNNGTSAGTPWLSPNHAISCGDIVTAAASPGYDANNFSTGKWGTVTCAGGNNVAWLKCATFDACKISTSSNNGMWIDKSYWGVQGWEVTTTAGDNTCFYVAPSYSTPVEIHHIIVANSIANGCQAGGFDAGYRAAGASVDYVAFIGDIAYNAAQGSANCYSGFSIYEPIRSDSLPGTHIYLGGNFAWDNFDPNPCASGLPTDGEGIILDSLDGAQNSLPVAYAGQVVVDNNITFLNGGRGILVSGSGNTAAPVIFRHNTVYGNLGDNNQSASHGPCGEIELSANDGVVLTQVFYNLARTKTMTGCNGNAAYAFWVWTNSVNTATDSIDRNFGYGLSGQNASSANATGFSYGPNNIFGTDPDFVNAPGSDPGAPNCGTSASVPKCMTTVIADFTPLTAAAIPYGYQMPSTIQTYDPLFPQWVCSANLPAGLATMNCASASSLPASVTITGVAIQ